ncbi:hypothetical protein BH09BAC5_BH09BAC5_02480 [soil metagenome]
MKKLLVVLALAGMVGSVSATTVSALTGNHTIVALKGDDKDKDKKGKKKKACKDGEKCCSKEKEGEKKGGCCADKNKTTEAAPATPKN